MDVFIGIDVAKEVHRACAMDRNARVLFSHAVDNDPAAIGALIDEIEGLDTRSTRTAVDMLGGAASLLCAMLAEAGLPLVHTPGLAVNRAHQSIRGGERKSDPKDAAVLAELARTRPDLRAVDTADPLDAEFCLLVSRRRELVSEQTRRAGRLRDLLSGLVPALERRIDPTTRTGLAPVLRQSGKTSFLRRATGGDKALKRVFHRAAFTSLGRPDSRAFHDRKRAEGKRHHQAVIALARRRVIVLRAMLRNRTTFRENFKLVA